MHKMSLEFRLTLSMILMSGLIILLGSLWAIRDARQSVALETQASLELALGLIDAAIGAGGVPDDQIALWIERLGRLERIRHLRITVTRGETGSITRDPVTSGRDRRVPPLFRSALNSSPLRAIRHIQAGDEAPLTVTVESNAADESIEAWDELRGFLLLQLTLLVGLALSIHVIAGRALKPVGAILQGLSAMEKGDYETRLPPFGVFEMDRLSQGINHLSASLHDSREENRSLMRHSLTIQEDERRSIAKELHDEFGQTLTAIRMMVALIGEDALARSRLLTDIQRACDRLFGVMRALVRRLRPQILEDLGLKAAVEELISSWHGVHPELKITLDCDARLGESRSAVCLELYRIIQEALTNTLRHAEATEARVSIQSGPEAGFELTVTDNGKGLKDNVRLAGFGLLGIRERVASLNGRFWLMNRPGSGLELRVLLPQESE